MYTGQKAFQQNFVKHSTVNTKLCFFHVLVCPKSIARRREGGKNTICCGRKRLF